MKRYRHKCVLEVEDHRVHVQTIGNSSTERGEVDAVIDAAGQHATGSRNTEPCHSAPKQQDPGPRCASAGRNVAYAFYTSGSTGKPKGLVLAHGGYLTGLMATSELVFDLQASKDVLFVVATPGWITGQSYMIAAALLCRVPRRAISGLPGHHSRGTRALS